MRVLKRGLKALMSIGMIAWTICAFAIAFNGVLNGDTIEESLEAIALLTAGVGILEGVLAVGRLTIREIER